MSKRLLMISTDRLIFEEGSAVRARQIEYAKNWDEVHMIIFDLKDSGNPREISISPNAWAYSTRSSSKFLYPFDAIKLGRFIIEKRGITEITTQDSSLTAMAGLSLKKEFKKRGKDLPVEIQIHEDIGSPKYGYNFANKIRKMMALRYIPQTDRIRVVSNKITDFLVGSLGVELSKITLKPIAVDVDWIGHAPIIETADLHKKYPQFDRVVLMASRLEKEKNISLALEAWKFVHSKMPKVGLIIVGDGSQKSKILKTLNTGSQEKSKTGLDRAVILEPRATKETLASYYKTADAFLNTSLYEGYGMTLVEAKAAGCPVISTDVGVAKEIGSIIIKYDPEDIAAKIYDQLA